MIKYSNDFINSIYNLIKEDHYLRHNLHGIYFNVQKEAKYPYILISYNHIINNSSFDKFQYEVNFVLSLFSRDPKNHLIIIDNIKTLLEGTNFEDEEWQVISCLMSKLEFSRSQDLLTHKIDICYNSIIKQK